MARTVITVQSLGAYGGKLEDLTWTALEVDDDMQFTHPGWPCLLLMDNDHDSSITITIPAVASAATGNNAEDLSLSCTNGEVSGINIPPIGYDQGSGVVHIDGTDEGDGDDVFIAVLALIPNP